MNKGQWSIVSKKEVFGNKWRTLEEWKTQLPNGTVADFFIQPGADVLTIFGMRSDGKILVIREYFIAAERTVFSLVGGRVENNDPATTAKHELREEAGCQSDDWVYLGSALISKYQTGSVHLYLAKNVEQVGPQHLEATEDIEVMFMDTEEFITMLKAGDLHGVFEVACAYKALNYLGLLPAYV